MKKIFTLALVLGLFLGFSCTENESIDPANTDDQTSKADDEATTEDEEAEIDSSLLEGLWSDVINFTLKELTFSADGGTMTTTAQGTEFCAWYLENICRITDEDHEFEKCYIYNKENFTEGSISQISTLAIGTYGALSDDIDNKETASLCCSGCYNYYQLLGITYDGFFNVNKPTTRDLVFTVEPNTSNVVRKARFYYTAGNGGGYIYITQEAAE